jgi:outer membrane protein OmpA-like peptidoglycan-associated protein
MTQGTVTAGNDSTVAKVVPVTKVVYFNENEVAPRDKTEEDKIMLIALFLRKHPEATVTVNGYADNVADGEKKSAELSKERAVKVANILISKYSIDKGRVTVNWYGARPNAALNKMVLVKTAL